MENRKGRRDLQNEYTNGTSSDNAENSKCQCLFLKRISNGIIWCMETFFYRLGKLVAFHPFKTIGLCLLVCGSLGVGLIKFHEERTYEKVWLPKNSRMLEETRWVKATFPESTRYTQVIVEADNVLAPTAVQAMMALYDKANNFQLTDGKNLTAVCVKAGSQCRISSVLEFWSYNDAEISSLTDEDILSTVNSGPTRSPVYGTTLDMNQLLGDVSRDANGSITAAKATTMLWILTRDSAVEKYAREWEKSMIDTVNSGDARLKNIFIYTARTFDDEGGGALNEDILLLSAGFGFVLIYVMVVIGKFNMVEHKVLLALGGLSSVALAILFCYGIGFATGILYSQINALTPFLLLGIGVDDIFVIVEALKIIREGEQRSGLKLPVEERIGLALKKAGVSITVTSVTDIVAFGIGGSTVIPSLSAFCVFVALGVVALYILQATYFVAFMTFDQRRLEARRDACIPCYTHADYTPNKCSQVDIQSTVMKRFYGPALMKWPVKVIVLLSTLGLLGVNIWSFINLETNFDYALYIPKDSYARRYVEADRKHFPDDGIFASVYCDDMDYPNNVKPLIQLYEGLTHDPDIQSNTVQFWLLGYCSWLNSTTGPNLQNLTEDGFPSSSAEFYQYLQTYIRGPGAVYARYLVFQDDSPPVLEASALTFRHVKKGKTTDRFAMIDSARDIVDNIPLENGRCFAYSAREYMWAETNRVLKPELYRNLALAAACVFVVTLFLITNIWTTLVVFTCVVFTVIDVSGTLQFWDVTIDTAASVLLILCFGLAVDYSAHVGHTFMVVKGAKNERAIRTLTEIGPPVFNGGLTTFLAFCLLAGSNSYGFELFFKTFTSVVLFGLYHGLVYLPVILSIIGPAPYDTDSIRSEKNNKPVGNGHIPQDMSDKSKNIYSIQNGRLHNLDRNGQIPGYRNHYVAGPSYEYTRAGRRIYIPPADYSPPQYRRY